MQIQISDPSVFQKSHECEENLEKLLQKSDYSNPVTIDNRISKIDCFMKVALTVAKRSPDAQTQVGAVVVNPEGRILSTGYNGFPRDIDYSLLPNTRPDKHRWMMHAERNAIAWCEHRPVGCTIYSSSETCIDCLFACWQHGITKIIEPIGHSNTNVNEETKIRRQIFLELSGMIVEKVSIDHLIDGV